MAQPIAVIVPEMLVYDHTMGFSLESIRFIEKTLGNPLQEYNFINADELDKRDKILQKFNPPYHQGGGKANAIRAAAYLDNGRRLSIKFFTLPGFLHTSGAGVEIKEPEDLFQGYKGIESLLFDGVSHQENDITSNIVLVEEEGERKHILSPTGKKFDQETYEWIKKISTKGDMKSKYLMLSGYEFLNSDDPSDVVDLAKEFYNNGAMVFFDVSDKKVIELAEDAYKEITKYCNVILANEEEYRKLLSIDSGMDGFLDSDGILVVKQGARGATAIYANNDISAVPLDKAKMKNSNGAGDAFFGGLMYSFGQFGIRRSSLSEKEIMGGIIKTSLEYGNLLAGIVCEQEKSFIPHDYHKG